MVTTHSLLAKIVAEKDKQTEARCFNCGKKLFECNKSKESTAKNTGICVSIICNRCKKMNEFNIK